MKKSNQALTNALSVTACYQRSNIGKVKSNRRVLTIEQLPQENLVRYLADMNEADVRRGSEDAKAFVIDAHPDYNYRRLPDGSWLEIPKREEIGDIPPPPAEPAAATPALNGDDYRSWKIMGAVQQRLEKTGKLAAVTGDAYRVLMFMASKAHADKKTGQFIVFWGQERIAEKLGINVRTIRRHVAALKEAGLIEIIQLPYHGSAQQCRILVG